ncbi:hypothetical protein [Catellatospora tritici]|uniref:hypothetical protein n=1 Tax=Catellatospora tritici TaxID=2851566 RepID=UPI001C2CD4D7|nr:hypothetical protein [Catellatospora tritici]MBV1853881.1 hypothetical protein [Catellatospora tritici]
MAFDVHVGLFLCAEDGSGLERRERLLAEVNATLRELGKPAHREPRALAEIDPPLAPATDPCLLGARLGFYGSDKYRRLAAFARYLAVHGTVAPADHPDDAVTEQRYDGLPDRRPLFDHVIAIVTGQATIVLPQLFDQVVWGAAGSVEHGPIVSAQRLRIESVALGYALRYVDSRTHDWISGSVLDDSPFTHLDARIEDDAEQAWADEADLCHRLLSVATDVLRTGALGVAG